MADGPIEKTEERTRTVVAPAAVGPEFNRIVSVVIGEDEDVVWEWTDLPLGGSFVSGYMTVPRGAEPVDGPDADEQTPDDVVASQE